MRRSLRAALEFARTLELDAIIVEGDSYQLVQILGNKISCPSNVEVIIQDIQRIAQQMGSCDFVLREANGVDHKLAGVLVCEVLELKCGNLDLLIGYCLR